MTEPAARIARGRQARSQPSLRDTVVSIAALAAVAAALVWSVLFIDLVRKESGAAATTAAATPTDQTTTAGSAQPAQTPASVTTRTS